MVLLGFSTYRELDAALGLTQTAGPFLTDTQTSKNGRYDRHCQETVLPFHDPPSSVIIPASSRRHLGNVE